MNLEERNAEKRKNAPLTNSEAASFFFIPPIYGLAKSLYHPDFNDNEMERFRKFGFERKIKEAQKMRFLGLIFYISLIIILAYLL